MLQNLPKVSKQFRRSTAIETCRQNCSTNIIFLPVFEWNVEAFKNIFKEESQFSHLLQGTCSLSIGHKTSYTDKPTQ
jgi:hypothetical protein